MSAAETRDGSLARRAARGGLWTLAGRGVSELLRLGSNLVLTRLLFPDAFGLMAIVYSLSQGARMVSDLGIRGSIVQNRRGEEADFANTAWTIQILRGFGIATALLLASGPAASFYGDPRIALLVRVIAINAALEGFTSTAVFALIRRIEPGPQIVRELVSQCVGIVAMFSWAAISPSPLALAAGAVASTVSQLVMSHRLIPGYRNRLRYERAAARSIVRFGRWIIFATLMTFLLQQGDRLVLGKLLTAAELGVYTIAVFLAQAVPNVTQLLSVNVLFPVYARLGERSEEEQRREIARYRAAVLGLALPLLWLLAAIGPELVSLLYDPRYHGAGWMLQMLAVGMIGTVISLSQERVLLARGDSFGHMLLQGSQALILIGGIALGWNAIGGTRGLLIGVSAARLAGYLPLAWLVRRLGLWQPRQDALAFAASVFALALVFAIRGVP